MSKDSKCVNHPSCSGCIKWNSISTKYDKYKKHVKWICTIHEKHSKHGLELVNVFRKFKGGQLTTLKETVEIFGKYDLFTVFHKLSNKNKHLLLTHFERYAKKKKKTHVLSDVDDTVFPASFQGGDKSWNKHEFYPGVLQLMYELSSDYVTFLSSRPSQLKTNSVAKFSRRCIPNTILPGTLVDVLHDGFLSVVKISIGTYDDMKSYYRFARKKVQNFNLYKKLFPEYTFIFFGDIGQGDIVVGKYILKDPSTLLVVIHDIVRSLLKNKSLFEERSSRENMEQFTSQGMIIGSNYVTVAFAIHSKYPKLISKKGMDRIIESALAEVKQAYNKGNMLRYLNEIEIIKQLMKQEDKK